MCLDHIIANEMYHVFHALPLKLAPTCFIKQCGTSRSRAQDFECNFVFMLYQLYCFVSKSWALDLDVPHCLMKHPIWWKPCTNMIQLLMKVSSTSTTKHSLTMLLIGIVGYEMVFSLMFSSTSGVTLKSGDSTFATIALSWNSCMNVLSMSHLSQPLIIMSCKFLTCVHAL